jgi:hypothetical protein
MLWVTVSIAGFAELKKSPVQNPNPQPAFAVAVSVTVVPYVYVA